MQLFYFLAVGDGNRAAEGRELTPCDAGVAEHQAVVATADQVEIDVIANAVGPHVVER